MKTSMGKIFGLLLFAGIVYAADPSNPLPINWHELPEPYATPSAVNPPVIVARPQGAALTVPAGFKVTEYMSGFQGPRFMLPGPNNEIFLSDMAAGVVYVIKDKQAKPLIKNLKGPYGLAWYQDWLYVADMQSVSRYPYNVGNMSAGSAEKLIDISDYASGHVTRTILIDKQQKKLYLTIGSRSNVSPGEPPMRAAINRFNLDGSDHEIFASGIRNAVGMREYPGTHELWITSHERDGLGDDLVPDYMTRVTPGGFYGWPYAYIGPHEEPRNQGLAPELVSKTLYPSVLLGGHVGPLDLLFYTGKQFPARYQGGAFVAFHGSWNRSKRAGYEIAFIPFKDGKPQSGPEDFLTGWMLGEDNKEVWGRPVGLLQLPDGSILISDDGTGKLWQVSYQATN